MIEIKNLSKEYSSDIDFRTVVLRNISFKIPVGKIASIIAPTGSGKSVLLKIISGLEEQTSGDVINPTEGKIIFIPSAPSSFPWLNVFENVKFGLDKWDEKNIKDLINLVGLEGYDTFYPDNKSLGFRLRIALARSLAHNPFLILLDEPFTQMDVQTKNELYILIRVINKIKGIGFLLATTNLTEALFLSDRICIMKKNPAEIHSEMDIDLPTNRNESTFFSDRFHQLRIQIEESFKSIESQKLVNLSI